MMDAAQCHRRGQNLLTSRVGDYGESAILLGVLAFEIALKAVHLSATGRRAVGHDYCRIWFEIPEETRGSVILRGHELNAGLVDLSDIEALLSKARFVFEKGRYSYEFIQGETTEAAKRRGQKWVERGAENEDADIDFIPLETESLTFGLFEWIAQKHDLNFGFFE